MPVSPANLKNKSHSCGLCCTKLKKFGVTIGKTEILRDIDLHIHCGELTALVGPNGGGKSTLLKAILGEIKHTGELSFLDANECRRNPVVGYVPQRLDFDPGSPVSVSDLFLCCLSMRPVCLSRAGALRERALAGLTLVQAGHLLDRRLGDLSGGELQRVLLAMALDPKPDLLLLDEPVSGIDVKGKELFYEIVSSLRRQYDLSIILVTHDWSLMSSKADRVVFLDHTVQCSGTPREVFSCEKVMQAYGPSITQEMDPMILQTQKIKSAGGMHA